jgi:NAD(P)-dependent dehydrogenase (short-subunit alcohol dehydrogenase family)
MGEYNNFNPFSLQGKNIIITGASSGIGRQCAISCSRMGANTILIGRNIERLQETLKSLYGETHLYFSLDMTNFDLIENVIEQCVEQLGKINGLIFCSGVEMTTPLSFMNYDRYLELYKINVFAPFETAKILSKNKYCGENASFVFISSIMGVVGQPGKVGYSGSKGAIVSAVKSMALEFVKKKIRANCISPAIVETEMAERMFIELPPTSKDRIISFHPYGFGKTEDIAYACIYFLSDASRWITGQNLILDGGYTIQ